MESWAVALVEEDVEQPVYVKNPDFDGEFRDEGITCAACHVRDGAVEGPTGIATEAHATRQDDRFLDETILPDLSSGRPQLSGQGLRLHFRDRNRVARQSLQPAEPVVPELPYAAGHAAAGRR